MRLNSYLTCLYCISSVVRGLQHHDHVSKFTIHKGLESTNSLVDDLSTPEEVTGYQLTDEETEAYWRSHVSSQATSARALSTTASNEVSILHKRGPESALACIAESLSFVDDHGHTWPQFVYRWMSARCLYPFITPHFRVVCDTQFMDYDHNWHDLVPVDFTSRCPERHVCMPWLRHGSNGIGQVGLHNDIACVMIMILPRPVFIQPKQKRSQIACSPDFKFPIVNGIGPARPKPIPRGGLTYLMSESIEISGGGEFNATKLFIKDNSKFLGSFNRGEALNTNETSSESMIFAGQIKTVNFCAQVAAGLTHWLALHYGAFDISDEIKRRNSIEN